MYQKLGLIQPYQASERMRALDTVMICTFRAFGRRESSDTLLIVKASTVLAFEVAAIAKAQKLVEFRKSDTLHICRVELIVRMVA